MHVKGNEAEHAIASDCAQQMEGLANGHRLQAHSMAQSHTEGMAKSANINNSEMSLPRAVWGTVGSDVVVEKARAIGKTLRTQ